ncbi:hypothetical protein JCM31271_29890 [Halorubrum trueperi]
MRDRLNVDLGQGNEVLGKEMERPARPSFRWIAAGESDEMCFFTSVKFALIDTVGLAASNRREAVLGIAFAESLNGSGMAPDGFTDLWVSQAVIRMQKTPCPREFPRFVGSSGQHRTELGSFIGRQIDDILFGSGHELLQRSSEYYLEVL